LTPVSLIPSRISRTNRSTIQSFVRYARKPGSSTNAYTPVATTMFRSTPWFTRWMRGMSRPRPYAGRVEDGLDPRFAQPSERCDRPGDALVLVPVGRPEVRAETRQRAGIEDEHVLVHERRAERVE
jgi:hypothetical protein